jgi:hypothetical protein
LKNPKHEADLAIDVPKFSLDNTENSGMISI